MEKPAAPNCHRCEQTATAFQCRRLREASEAAAWFPRSRARPLINQSNYFSSPKSCPESWQT